MWDEQSNRTTHKYKLLCYQSAKWPPLILFWGLHFWCGRENSMYQRTVLLRLGYNQPTSKQAQGVCEFVWLKDVANCFGQSWRQKWGSLPLLSLVTDASMVMKRCWLLEGKATQLIKQQAEIVAFLAIIQIKPPDVLCRGAWTAGHETTQRVQILSHDHAPHLEYSSTKHLFHVHCQQSIFNPRCVCAARVTVLGLCVCVSVCVSGTQHLTFYAIIRATNDTNLLSGGWRLKILSDFLWKCFVAKLEYFLLVRLHDKSAIFFTSRKTRMRINLDHVAPTKLCRQCKAAVPVRQKTCEHCDHAFWSKRKAEFNLQSLICERKLQWRSQAGAHWGTCPSN